MTLGPAFGAPPPSDFNEPHDLHREPAPVDPDEALERDSTAELPSVKPASDEPAKPAAEEPAKGLSRWFGWLRRSG
ncbi:MAG: hypothetical protein ABWY52_01700 [Candidatus Limnocylindrales bacterium]